MCIIRKVFRNRNIIESDCSMRFFKLGFSINWEFPDLSFPTMKFGRIWLRFRGDICELLSNFPAFKWGKIAFSMYHTPDFQGVVYAEREHFLGNGRRKGNQNSWISPRKIAAKIENILRGEIRALGYQFIKRKSHASVTLLQLSWVSMTIYI